MGICTLPSIEQMQDIVILDLEFNFRPPTFLVPTFSGGTEDDVIEYFPSQLTHNADSSMFNMEPENKLSDIFEWDIDYSRWSVKYKPPQVNR